MLNGEDAGLSSNMAEVKYEVGGANSRDGMRRGDPGDG